MKRAFAIFLFIAAFLILVGLGTWQIKRLQWKENIIAKLEQVYAQNPDNTVFNFDDLTVKDSNLPILYGSVEGQLNYSKEILYGPHTQNQQIGFNVITPLLLKDGGYVFVNRGFIAEEKKNQLALTHVQGKIKISGLIRQTDWNRFTPSNSPANNIWTKLDISEMASAKNIKPIAPLMIYAEKSSKDFKVLEMQPAKWIPRNKHLQYAIFWYTMALVLCGFFISYKRFNKF